MTTEIRRHCGTVFLDVTCDELAKRTMRSARMFGGQAALFVCANGLAVCMAIGTWPCDTAMRNSGQYLVGVYEWNNNDCRSPAYRETQERISGDVWHHMREMRGACVKLERALGDAIALECGAAA